MSTVSLKISRKRIRLHRPSFSRVMLYIFLCLMVVVCALPLFAMVCRALMPLDELYLYPPRLIVQKPSLRNFSDLLTSLSSSTVPARATTPAPPDMVCSASGSVFSALD